MTQPSSFVRQVSNAESTLMQNPLREEQKYEYA